MIVVEGLDNTGKTTLVGRLLDDVPGLTHQPSIGNKHDLAQIARQAWDEANVRSDRLLCDRSRLISEYVYNPVLQNRRFAFDHVMWMECLARWVRTPQMVIYCKRDLDNIRAGFDDREQLSGVSDVLGELNESYDSVMTMVRYLFFVTHKNHRFVEYDFDQEDEEGSVYGFVLSEVNKYLEGCN